MKKLLFVFGILMIGLIAKAQSWDYYYDSIPRDSILNDSIQILVIDAEKDSTYYMTTKQLDDVLTGSGGSSVVTDLTGTANRVLYVDGSGDVVELALGADGTYLMSNGASAAPTFESGGSGDVTMEGASSSTQIPIYSSDGLIRGSDSLTWSSGALNVLGGNNITTVGSTGVGGLREGGSYGTSAIIFSDTDYENYEVSTNRFGGTVASPSAAPTNADLVSIYANVSYDGSGVIKGYENLVSVNGTVPGTSFDVKSVYTMKDGSATDTTFFMSPDSIRFPNMRGAGTGSSMVYYNRNDGEIYYGDAPAGSGDVSVSGNPVDNQIATWTNSTTIEGASDFTFDGDTLRIPALLINGDSAVMNSNLVDGTGVIMLVADSMVYDGGYVTPTVFDDSIAAVRADIGSGGGGSTDSAWVSITIDSINAATDTIYANDPIKGDITATNKKETSLVAIAAWTVKATYDFATDGGSVGDAMGLTAEVPSGAVITRVIGRSNTAFTSGGSATIAINVGTTEVLTATAYDNAAFTDVDVHYSTPVEADGEVNIDIGTAALTAGNYDIWVEYLK